MNGSTFRLSVCFAAKSLNRAWVVPTILAFTMQGTPALSQVRAGDAPSRAAPSNVPKGATNVGPMGRPAPITDAGPKGGGRTKGEATQRQCENLLKRAAAVQALRQGEDYEFCRARFPDIQPPEGATSVTPDAPSKK
jgi:hypothetical protein